MCYGKQQIVICFKINVLSNANMAFGCLQCYFFLVYSLKHFYCYLIVKHQEQWTCALNMYSVYMYHDYHSDFCKTNVGLIFSSCNPVPSWPSVVKDTYFKYLYCTSIIVSWNKTGPLCIRFLKRQHGFWLFIVLLKIANIVWLTREFRLKLFEAEALWKQIQGAIKSFFSRLCLVIN